MKTFIILNNKKKRKIPKEFRSDDNRNPEVLVEYFLKKYTKKGDKVIDIFAGLGTSLFIAEKMGRVPFGIELDKKRFIYLKHNLKHKENVFLGDARKLDSHNLPKFDFCFTSPPYMAKNNTRNPFTVYSSKGTYQQYLKDIRKVFIKLKKLMKNNAFIVVEVSNLRGKDVTTLAWDFAKVISNIFHFEVETVVGWKGRNSYKYGGTYGYGYDHSYCLIFRKTRIS